jgi:acetolactate decarboxylase
MLPLMLRLGAVMMHIAPDLLNRLELRSRATGEPVDDLLNQLLRQGLARQPEKRALYVSAPVNALIEGIYQENTTISDILEH